jgi:tetratricopeptide (TPR) repeat protein
MHLEQRQFDAALKQADTVLRAQRSNPAAWALKADVLRKLGDQAQALDCYHRALIYKPDWPEVQVTVAELYQEANRPQRALATLDRLSDQRAVAQLPPRAWVLRGRALASLGESAEARTCLRQAAYRMGPENPDLLMEIAQLQYELGDLVEARLCLGRATQHNPHDPRADQLQNDIDSSLARLATANMSAETGGLYR